ncbi:MAG TPA: Hsp20/alpha crystallin family protein [Vicinamibacterales bacterium]|nr:Hsp20/alpha crystallin family protein [Vicinamibacterales bacterium]
MNLTRIDPWRDLETLSTRLNRLFNTAVARPDDEMPFGDWLPAMDVEETDADYLIKADLPAIRREDVKVGVTDGVLTIEGERKQEKEEKNRKFHKVERSFGKFVRRMSVPTDVDQSKIEAEVKDGLLRVRLPKSVSAKPRSVEIKVA